MRAIGVHTYFGGFHIGVGTRAEVVTSLESWRDGIKGRELLGLVTDKLENTRSVCPKADLVFGNPPCSRFSTMSANSYSEQDRSNPSDFKEVQDLIDITLASGAEAMWWETGPLMWNRGEGMVRGIHSTLEHEWGEVTSVVVKYDLRYAGLPQRRPRCHLIHLRGKRVPPVVRPPAWPSGLGLYEWLQGRGLISDSEAFLPPRIEKYPVYEGGGWVDDPLGYSEWVHRRGGFQSTKPAPIGVRELYTLSVVSGRYFIWQELNRWWGIDEYASVMDYPVGSVVEVAEELGPHQAQVLMSKSVSPSAARFVFDNVYAPMVDIPTPAVNPSEDGTRKPEDAGGGVWYLDLSVADRPHRKDPYR